MGVAAPFIPYAIAALSTAATIYNTNRTARKADEAAAAGIRSQAATQRKATSRVDEALAQIGKSSPDQAQASALQQYQQATRGTEQQARAGQAIEGLSKAYDAATQAGQGNVAGKIGTIADLLSRIDAPALQRQQEAFVQGNLGSALDVLGKESQGQNFLTGLKVNAVRRSPYIDAFAAGLNAAAKNYAATSGGGRTTYGANTYSTPQTIGTGSIYGGYA